MEPTSLFWADLGWRDFEQLRASEALTRVVAVLPISATEQHGPHLPVCVDAALSDAIVARSLPHLNAACTPALFLPAQHVGLSTEHRDFPGTLSLAPATLLAMWNDIGASVAAAGIRKMLFFNTHGGNAAIMDVSARELRARHAMMVWHSSWNNLPRPPEVEQLLDAHERRFGIHAGEEETSMMLALHPDLVHMDAARHFRTTAEEHATSCAILGNGKSARTGWMMQDRNPRGAAGNACAASAEKGRLLLDNAARQLALLLAEISGLPLPE